MAATDRRTPTAPMPRPSVIPLRLPDFAMTAAIGVVPMARPTVLAALGRPASDAEPSRSSETSGATTTAAMNPMRAIPLPLNSTMRRRRRVDAGTEVTEGH